MRLRALLASLGLLLSSGCISNQERPLAEPTIVLANAKIIDGTGNLPLDIGYVVIEGGTVRDVGVGSPPAGAHVINLFGKTVLPGLIDAHQHLTTPRSLPPEKALPDLLARGVTSVRDMGGDLRKVTSYNERVATGELSGPKIYSSAVLYGPAFLDDRRSVISQPGFQPGTAPWSRVVTDETDLGEVMNQAWRAGASGVKIYTDVSANLLVRIVDAAHKRGLMVWSHSAPLPARPRDAVAAGVDVLSHAGPYWITEVAEDWPSSTEDGFQQWAAGLDFDNVNVTAQPFQVIFSEMAERQIILEPTLAAPLGFELAVERIQGRSMRPEGALGQTATSSREAFKCRLVDRAHSLGVPIAAGVDGFGDALILEEIKLLSSCGLTPLQAITAATSVNARAIGISDRVGTIEPGKAADLLVVDGDPLENLDNLTAVFMVIKGGVVIEP